MMIDISPQFYSAPDHPHQGWDCGRVEPRCWVNFQCRGVLLVWMIVGQGPTAFKIGAGGGGGGLDIFFSHLSFLFAYSLSLGDCPIYCIVVVVLLFTSTVNILGHIGTVS